ncbi:MAG: ABC transporter ATP-binding protein/permease [Lachnospiraceae bacterium]|nr:ABC transporter ATP-binding protein/permease [Lachnospiraceae bacterium]
MKNKPTIHWLFSQIYAFLPQLSVIVFLNSVVTFTGIYMAVIAKNLIDSATSLVSTGADISPAGAGVSQMLSYIPAVIREQPDILRNISLYLAIIMINLTISMTASFLSVYLNEKFEFFIRRKMFDNIMKSKWPDITGYHSEDLMVRLTSDVRNVASGLINTCTTIVVLVVGLIAAFGTLFYYDRVIAVFAFALGPIAVYFSVFFGKKIKFYQEKVQESEAKYRAFMQENIANIIVVKSFTAEDLMSERLYNLYRERMKIVVKKNRLTIFLSTIVGLSFSLGYIGALSWGVLKISMNMMSFGTLSIFLSLVARIQSPIMGLAQTVPHLSSIIASAGRIIEIDEQMIEGQEKAKQKVSKMGIIFKDVNYSYKNKKVFDRLNLEIKPGSLVAVTGASGIGKTTLIRLMMNFVEVAGGAVTYRGISEDGGETEMPVSPAVRDYISYVPQGNTLFSGSIKDNLLIGNQELQNEDICNILKAVALLDFVNSLPDGIETIIGEKGHGLSEGQAERIAIARALAKSAPVVIFDEATAALDEKNEQEIIKSIRNIKNHPTCIFITHRRGTLSLMDEEINLEKILK